MGMGKLRFCRSRARCLVSGGGAWDAASAGCICFSKLPDVQELIRQSGRRAGEEQRSGLNLPPLLVLPQQQKKKSPNRLILLSRGFLSELQAKGKQAAGLLCASGSGQAALAPPSIPCPPRKRNFRPFLLLLSLQRLGNLRAVPQGASPGWETQRWMVSEVPGPAGSPQNWGRRQELSLQHQTITLRRDDDFFFPRFGVMLTAGDSGCGASRAGCSPALWHPSAAAGWGGGAVGTVRAVPRCRAANAPVLVAGGSGPRVASASRAPGARGRGRSFPGLCLGSSPLQIQDRAGKRGG